MTCKVEYWIIIFEKYGADYGGRWRCVSSGGFSIFCRRSPHLVHLESVNNTLIEKKVSYSPIFARETCDGRKPAKKFFECLCLSSHKAFYRDKLGEILIKWTRAASCRTRVPNR